MGGEKCITKIDTKIFNIYFQLVVILCLSLLTILLHSNCSAEDESPVGKEYQGTWVPAGKTCKSEKRVEIYKDHLLFVNKKDVQKFGDLDMCFSCAGGPHGESDQVWLVADFNNPPGKFTIIFFEDERRGKTFIDEMRVEYSDTGAKLRKRFPFDKISFKKCAKPEKKGTN